MPRWLRRSAYLTVSTFIGIAMFGALFTVAYLIKSRLLGVDIFPNFHLHDVLPFDLFIMPGQERP
jgi:hypothetical protein